MSTKHADSGRVALHAGSSASVSVTIALRLQRGDSTGTKAKGDCAYTS